jgi:hypothetical protein
MRTRRVSLAIFLPVLFILFYSSNLSATNENGCIDCHTDGERLKKLSKLPPISEEGEG